MNKSRNEKIRKALLAYYASHKDDDVNKERRRKISEAQKRIQANLTPKQREERRQVLIKANKIANSNRKPWSDEAKRGLSEKQKLIWESKSDEEKENFSKKISEVHKLRSKKEKKLINEKRSKSYNSRSIEEKTETSRRIREAALDRSEEEKARIFQKTLETKRKNKTFHTSNLEDKAYKLLVQAFDSKSVYRNKSTKYYPFACDFIVKFNDSASFKTALYIECNFHWTHGGRPFNPEDSFCRQRLRKWKKKAKTSDFYKNAIKVWTERDIKKRQYSKDLSISWFEFWSYEELSLWLERSLGSIKISGSYTDSDLLKAYNRILYKTPLFVNEFTFNFQPHFYREELKLWENPEVKFRLLANRKKYLNKSSIVLTNQEILSGFRKSRIVKNKFSHFPVRLVQDFIDHVKPKRVYDPCAGWGTRLLGFVANDVEYFGNDSWNLTYVGLKKIARWLRCRNSTLCKLTNLDAAENDMRKGRQDSVFTCPPYPLGVEHYNGDAEVLDLDDYWKWWNRCVKMSVSRSTKTVGLVVPEKYLSSYRKPIEKLGFILVKKVRIFLGGRPDNHLVRRKTHEVFLVWRKEC